MFHMNLTKILEKKHSLLREPLFIWISTFSFGQDSMFDENSNNLIDCVFVCYPYLIHTIIARGLLIENSTVHHFHHV